MKKLLILIVVFAVSVIFSGCERVQAKSPPASVSASIQKQTKVMEKQSQTQFVIIADSSVKAELIKALIAEKVRSGTIVVVSPDDVFLADSEQLELAVKPPVILAAEFALESQYTIRTAPDTRGNSFILVGNDRIFQRGINYDSPPERFLGFGSDNNARAKI